ncbi:TonB family protein [Lichenibacterium minor]|uniref:TonB family protein n=1 Tax=Lichenibacterium minor TaxID=2316528 RepID=A0A4Q2U6R5_9HYPH|nr:energy transducer TonB [Lichenibacterium minor]RYC30586.1 TonB family protein [Lichenibacterium minor]
MPPPFACRRSNGLISIDASGPTSADVPPDARLGDAPHLQALHEPAPRLDLVPRHILQRAARRGWRERAGGLVGFGGGAILVHVALAAAFFYLLSFRDAETQREVEIPVEVVHEVPKPASATAATKGAERGNGGAGPVADAKAGAAKPASSETPSPVPARPQQKPPAPTQDAKLAAALSPPSPVPPSPPRQPAPSPTDAGKPTAAAPPGETAPPKLVAPPPDAARAATQDRDNKAANLVPDEHQADQATREARPAAVPQVLTTGDPTAASSVPSPAKAPAPVDRPSPPTVAKVPSTADKLAAALPMDAAAMPMSFRSVLAGNATAQINAAYAGVVQGRIRQAQVELARTAFAQRLSGNVAITFTVDDAGKLTGLGIVQSSGNAQLDALALHAIELAAPFPPPPPEADHTFNKAFLVGG